MMWHAINIPVVCFLRGSLMTWHAINIPVVRLRWRAVYQTALTQDTACCQYGHSLCENTVETMAHYESIYLLKGEVTRHIYFVGIVHSNAQWYTHSTKLASGGILKNHQKGKACIHMGILTLYTWCTTHIQSCGYNRIYRKWRFCTMLIQCDMSCKLPEFKHW